MSFQVRVATLSFVAAAMAGCGGGGAGIESPLAQPAADAAAQALAPAPTLAAAGAGACGTQLPALPSVPAGARKVTDFGAVPNDAVDDTVALQRALNALREGEWLVFPPGKYLHNKSLTVDVKGSKLWGEGAVLHGTNPEDQAIWIRNDDVAVYRFTKTAVTDRRRSAPWDSGIAIYSLNGVRPVYRTVIRGNRLTYAGAAGTNVQASASSAGIMVYKARDFLIAENTVERTLADGIHMTAGSRNGRVLNNVVRETGDDMIAVVSYLGSGWVASASADSSWLNGRREADQVRDVLIANNQVSGQYWGRGVSVVGGSNVTIQGNRIARTTAAAAIYLAREQSYHSFGNDNVLVVGNTIDDNQVSRPAFVPSGSAFTGLQRLLTQPSGTGHAAIEVYVTAEAAEMQARAGTSHLHVKRVRIENNAISNTLTAGIRLGNYSPAGTLSGLSVVGNRMTQTRQNPGLQVVATGLADALHCHSNTDEGVAVTAQACTAATATPVTGATLTCQ